MSSESSAWVQREAESERAELVSTLDQLRENLKPENMVDEVMAGARLSPTDITDKVWETARANPIASVLIGLGAAMLLSPKSLTGSRQATPFADAPESEEAAWTAVRRPDPVNRSLDEPPAPGRTAARQTPSSEGQVSTVAALTRATDKAKRRLVSQLRVVGSKAAASTAQISNSAAALRKQAVRAVSPSSARDGLSSMSGAPPMVQSYRSRSQIAGSVSRLLDEQPLVLAALGVAVGAAIGAAIPSTETEGRLMGDASSSVKSRAQELAQQEYGHLKDTVAATVDNLKQTAADHGLSAENLSGLVQDTSDTVKGAATDLADRAAGTAPSARG